MNHPIKIHLIGIGGIGMSGIARMYLAMGYSVQGSDIKKSGLLDGLERLGAKILIGHSESHVNGSDWVVYSSSIAENHPERLEAVKKGLRILHRAEALAEICKGKYTIAITGTHGKTTTTALTGMILREAGRDPSIVVGGLVSFFGGNAHYGRGPEIVIEADESDSSFLKFSPNIEVITNIEAEHMEHFQTIERVEEAYRNFIARLPENGEWFGCAEDSRVVSLARQNGRPSTLYGFEKSASGLTATDVVECPKGRRGVSFKAWSRGLCLGPIEMKVIGTHNVLNALAAMGVGLKLGISFEVIQRALGKYEGAGRRFDVKYEDNQFLIVDDYAHHPTEIQKTLLAAKALKKKRTIAFFQPHRFSRTEALLEDFGGSFQEADKLIVTDIYTASEAPRPGITGSRVSEAIRQAGHRDVSFVERAALTEHARRQIKPGDLVITLGAGDISEMAHEIADFVKSTIFSSVRGKALRNEPLSRHTSLKVGGPADFWIEPEDAEDLKTVFQICRERAIPIYIFGAGSNILVPDKGIRGAVVHLSAPYFREIKLENGKIKARAGLQNTLFIQYALEQSFGGCEFLLGIPGCVGGSVAMNAGSHKQSLDQFVETVTVLDYEGQLRVLKKKDIPFRYRASGLKGCAILEAEFRLPKADGAATQRKLEEYRDYRLRTQDLKHPSAGCMFKNPQHSECSSGKLIEDAGLKGKTIGRAQVSEIHANFIINLGGASANDVMDLLEEVKNTVKRKFTIDLETEVKIL